MNKDLENSLVGRGFTSDVYAYGEGRVLKLFHAWVPRARAERECAITRAVRAAGVPAPDAYEVIEVGGRHGVVFERIHGVSMLRQTQAKPWRLFRSIRQLAEIQAELHHVVCPVDLPSQHDRIAKGIAMATDASEEDKAEAQRRLAGLPQGTAICHGDFHPENVLLTSRGPIVIDWDSASRGDPVSDIACTSRLIQTAGLPAWAPGYMHFLLKCTRTLLHRSYLKRSLELRSCTWAHVRSWEAPLTVASKAWRIPSGKKIVDD